MGIRNKLHNNKEGENKEKQQRRKRRLKEGTLSARKAMLPSHFGIREKGGGEKPMEGGPKSPHDSLTAIGIEEAAQLGGETTQQNVFGRKEMKLSCPVKGGTGCAQKKANLNLLKGYAVFWGRQTKRGKKAQAEREISRAGREKSNISSTEGEKITDYGGEGRRSGKDLNTFNRERKEMTGRKDWCDISLNRGGKEEIIEGGVTGRDLGLASVLTPAKR